jgi:hypothetical protein
MSKKIKNQLDEFHYHEMLDRLHMIISIGEDYLLQHPVCEFENKVKQNIEKALLYLAEAYQTTGDLSLKRFENESNIFR